MPSCRGTASFAPCIVGDGPLAGTLAPAAAAHGIELLGPRSDVPEILRSSEIFMFTSLPTGEGMPGVLIEAGLSGLPTVTTPVPGAHTVIQDGTTGIIVDDSVTSMVSAVGSLLDDRLLQRCHGCSGTRPMRIGIQSGSHGPALASCVEPR